MRDVIKRRGGVREKTVAQNEPCVEEEQEGDVDDAEKDKEEYEIDEEESVLDCEDQHSGDVEEQPKGGVVESEDNQHDSRNPWESDEEQSPVVEPPTTARKCHAGKGRRVTIDWDEPEDTRKLLVKLEEFAMRDHHVNRTIGTWRNNVFGEVSKMLGKPAKQCSNKYTRLKYRYLDIMKLLGLRVGLVWDDENNEVHGTTKAWKEVADANLLKIKGEKFLFKEEFDNLNELLNWVSTHTPKASRWPENGSGPAPKTSDLRWRPADINRKITATFSHVDENGGSDKEVADETDAAESGVGQDDPGSDFERTEPSSRHSKSSNSVPKKSSIRRKDRFDVASTHELVRLLVEYVQDDYYISPMSKTWANGVFKEISVKIGKGQKRCQWKYMSLRHAYMEIEKLLSSNFGFEWDPQRREVVGSNEAWARVKGTNLTRHRRSEFLFKDEFAKLAEKLKFKWREDAYRNRKRDRKRERTSARTVGSRPSYVDPPEEIEQSADGEDQDEGNMVGHACTPSGKKRLFNDTLGERQSVAEDQVESAGAEEADEPPRKRRLLSDTYEKRREAFYVAAANVSFKREELKAMVKAQLAIQHQQVAIHREQIAALHAQLTVETKLSKSLEDCHLKDTLRRDTLEGLRSTAHSRLQHEPCLTPLGKLTIMRTLPDLRSKAEGYLGVMFLDPVIRKLGLKVELEKLAAREPSEYFIDDDIGKAHKKVDTSEILDEDSGFTLVNDDDFELEFDEIDAAIGACENDDSGVGVHFQGDGCSYDPVEAEHGPCDEKLQGEQPVGDAEGKADMDAFEIDPYISIEETPKRKLEERRPTMHLDRLIKSSKPWG